MDSMIVLHTLSLSLHIIALAIWVGGMAFFLIVFGPAVQTLKPSLGVTVLNQGRMRFETLSWIGIGLLVVTGVLNLVLRGQTTATHPGQFYMIILSVKLVLFLAMLAHHGLQVFKYGPKIVALTNQATDISEAWPEPLCFYWTKWFLLLKFNSTLGPIAMLFGLALAKS